MPMPPLVIGHRGAAGHAPENTLAAFREGLRLGADGVECDVHLSRDGKLVVIHDATVDRTTDGTGRVGDFSFAELQKLDAGGWYEKAFVGERIPCLEEVLALVQEAERSQGRKLFLYVELKHGDEVYPGIEEGLLQLVASSELASRVGVIGFDHRAIARMKARAPWLRTGVLYDARPLKSASLAMEAGADWIGPSVKWVDAEEVAAARKAGLGIFVWTANDDEAMRRVLALGVTAIGSDYPDRLLAMRAKSRFPATKSF